MTVTVRVAVREGIRTDVTEALPDAISDEFGDIVGTAEEDKAETEEHEIRPYLPAVELALSKAVEKEAFESLLTELGKQQECTYELRTWETES